MRPSTLLMPLILLALLALLTFWVDLNVQAPANRSDANKRHDPDYYMTNFVNKQTDKNGDLRFTLNAQEMKHYPDDDSTDLIQPLFTKYESNKPYITVRGDNGEISKNGEDIKLYKNVRIKRAAVADQHEMTLETSYLNILTNKDQVITQEPVVIKEAPKTVVNAIGMVYDKKLNKIWLLSKVRAHYEKPSKKGKMARTVETLASKKPTATKNDIKSMQDQTLLEKNLPNPEKMTDQNKPTQTIRIRRHYD